MQRPEKWYRSDINTHYSEAASSQPLDLVRYAQNQVHTAYDYVKKDKKHVPDKERLKKARDLWQEKIGEVSERKSKGPELSSSQLLDEGYKAARKTITGSQMLVSTAADKMRLLQHLKRHLPSDEEAGPSQEMGSETLAEGYEQDSGLAETSMQWPPPVQAQYHVPMNYAPDVPVEKRPTSQYQYELPANYTSNMSVARRVRISQQDVTYTASLVEYGHLAGDPYSLQRYQGWGLDIERSDPRLITQYHLLMRAQCFQKLDQIVTFNQKIILSIEDSSRAYYHSRLHQIILPEKAINHDPEPEVRGIILWEMHNAKCRDRFQNLGDLRPTSSTPPEIAPRMRASYALAKEWYEWVKIIECDLRTEAINDDPEMRREGLYVARRFAPKYREMDQGWYKFANCLEVQIKADPAHTALYDPAAGEPDWVGRQILEKVERENEASLMITKEQVYLWQQRRVTNIESPHDNPFISPACWE